MSDFDDLSAGVPPGLLGQLLPRTYWARDDGTLAVLLAALEEQIRSLRAGVADLYDDVFVQTCPEWLLPYFGEKVGLFGLAPATAPDLSLRSWVARSVAFRRRKGTLATVMGATSAATGWQTYARVGVDVVARTVDLADVTLRRRTIDVRDRAALADLDAPWSRAVRGAGGRWPSPLHVEVSVWRLRAYTVTDTIAAPVGDGGRAFTFDPLGADVALFTPNGIARPITRELLAGVLDIGPDIRTMPFGIEWIGHDERALGSAEVAVGDLSEWQPVVTTADVVVDPVLGRILCTAAAPDALRVSYSYGAPTAIGATSSMRGGDAPNDPGVLVVELDDAGPLTTIGDALAAAAGHDGTTWIVIGDSATYVAADAWRIELAHGQHVVVSALPGTRPALDGDLEVVLRGGARLDLLGVLVGGRLVVDGSGTVSVAHATLVPSDDPSIVLDATGPLALLATSSILGPIAARGPVHVSVRDSIVDGGGADAVGALDAPVTTLDLDGTTVLGPVTVMSFLGRESIVTGRLTAVDPSRGYVRSCWFPPGSSPPAASDVVPEPAAPVFTSTTFGHPAYCQLSDRSPAAVLAAGPSRVELGAFGVLESPVRERRLHALLDELVPAGVSATVRCRS